MAPPPGRSHPGRPLVALGIILLALVSLVFFAGAHGSVRQRLAPKLGLDLIGGTRVTLAATTPDGRAQIELPLAGLAPGDYAVEIAAASPAGQAKDTLRFRVTN